MKIESGTLALAIAGGIILAKFVGFLGSCMFTTLDLGLRKDDAFEHGGPAVWIGLICWIGAFAGILYGAYWWANGYPLMR